MPSETIKIENIMPEDNPDTLVCRNLWHFEDLASHVISCFKNKVHTDVVLYSHNGTTVDNQPIEAHSIVLANAFLNFTELCIRDQGT